MPKSLQIINNLKILPRKDFQVSSLVVHLLVHKVVQVTWDVGSEEGAKLEQILDPILPTFCFRRKMLNGLGQTSLARVSRIQCARNLRVKLVQRLRQDATITRIPQYKDQN